METVIDDSGKQKRVPTSTENCLGLWCYHCYYYKNDVDQCLDEGKRAQED